MAENLRIKKSPVDSVLECPLCLHQLTLPQTLQQCLHSYCKSCLDKVPQKTQDGGKGWLCAMCEQFTKCDQVQQNTFIEQLQKSQSESENYNQIKCEICSENCGPASWKCAECKIGLCENGKAVHLKFPMLKGHNVKPLDSDGENFIDNIGFCNVHEDIPSEINCQSCDQLICYMCIMNEHQDHRAESVEKALERILPETQRSIIQVNKNIDIMEAQMEGVNKEVKQVKESYASCRMQIDEHLEKVISRMRAIKAQMEEDVNEQESIALVTLKKVKQQLEKQLSQARIISNLTAVVTTKTKHTSQLQQLQTGLLENVKSAAEVKSQSICFNLSTANFIEGQRLQKEIDFVFGKLDFDTKEQMINITGVNCTKSNQFLCNDFNELETKIKKDKEIVVDVDWCNHLSYFDNVIWLPLRKRNVINIYDEDGELEDVIDTGNKAITVVKEAHNRDVICAGDSGLYVTDLQFNKWTTLSIGKFSDVVIDNDQFIALQFDVPSVHTYSRVKPVDNGEENSWHESHSFILNEDLEVECGSHMCSVDDKFLLISTDNGLYKFTSGGEYLDSCTDLPFYPIICGTDENNQVLVADFEEGALYLFKPLSEKEIQSTAILSDVHTPETRSVVIDKNGTLWVLAGNQFNGFSLIKYISEQ